MTYALFYGCFKFGFALGYTAFCAVCGFLAVPVVISAVGWTLVVLVMRGNAKR